MADSKQVVLTSTSIDSLPKIAEGKVRDLYEVDSKTLLFVASDRISAYDVIMENVRFLEKKLLTTHLHLRYSFVADNAIGNSSQRASPDSTVCPLVRSAPNTDSQSANAL